MMEEGVTVEVLHHILDQISSNVLGDCCEIIEKLFDSIQCTEALSIDKTLCSIKLLLKLYEKIHLNNAETESILPAKKILQGVKYISRKTYFNKSAQTDLLSIISVLCKIRLTCKIPNFSELLIEFYNDILGEIPEFFKRKECDSARVTLFLEILRTLYGSQFCERHVLAACRQQESSEVEEDLKFAVLALRGDESTAVLTSLFLVPEFIKFFKTNAPIKYIWDEFSKWNSQNISRIFLILCNFLSVNLLIDETNLVEFLAGEVRFWEFIQRGLLNGDSTRKQAMYLLTKTIDALSRKRGMSTRLMKSVKSLPHPSEFTSEGNPSRHWDPYRRDELIKTYSDIILILEYLNEEQVHIVRPVFEMIEKVTETIIRCDLLSFSWILLIYELLLKHESVEVSKWGTKSLLKVSRKIFVDEAAVQKVAFLLILKLRDIDLYYDEGLDVTEALGDFFENIAELKNAAVFFKTFIKELCKLVWSPESLFFVTRAFSKLGKFSFWGPEEIADIRMFASKAFRTHRKIIRNGIQCEMINAVLALTHDSALPLDSLMLLFSKFSTSEIFFRDGFPAWDQVVIYLKGGYSREDAERVLNLFLNTSRHNEECAALSITLFHHAFEEDFAEKSFFDSLSAFKNSQQRPYCDASALSRYLLIISEIVEEHIQHSRHPKLVALVFLFFEDLVLYIHSQIGEVSMLKDFSACNSCLKAFESLIKLLNANKDKYSFEGLCDRLLKSLETDLCCKQELSSAQKYFGTRLLKIILESSPYESEPVRLSAHILRDVNKPLKREDNAADAGSCWGRMSSDFFDDKWAILENLIRNGRIRITGDETGENDSVHYADLLGLCLEGLNVGRCGAVCPIINILARVLPLVQSFEESERIVNLTWSITLERRKSDKFKSFAENFVAMLFQKKLFSKKDVLQIVAKYTDLIFADSSLVMVQALITHAEKLEFSNTSMPVLCRILAKGLLFGPVQKKDEKLTAQVCSYVESFWNLTDSDGLTSCKIRARAAAKLLSIRREEGVSKTVLDILMQAEREISKQKTRSFGNSFIHRIKTRAMQGVLLLLDSCKQEEKKTVAEWVYLNLMAKNVQTSVRNLQEWSLSLLYKFCYSSFNFFEDAVEKTPKGWCSLITITYLLAEASLCEIDKAIREILPFCMDQRFEARLYAEVVIVKLYRLAEKTGSRDVLEKWKDAHDCIKKSISRAEGNAAKNYAKLAKHFFFNGFNIHTHYSLQTIYYDLPRLTNVASDEWIPPGLLDAVSRLNSTEWVTEKAEGFRSIDEPTGVLENYQKKMIPTKPSVPGCNGRSEAFVEPFEEEGLIVVASLIDRIPNLGGLARTCEVFGVSQLVLNTAKCVEDKDFKSLSVTAEKWIRVKEVRTESLVEYMIDMKKKGFFVIGAEQTMYSEPLTKTKFPRRSLLVLGNEKRGIPPNLIPFLDVCVEIPQAGIIRSLNVHVTGALFLWEYAKQNLF